MPSLQIPDLPADLHNTLRLEAKRSHRTLTQHAIHLLYQGLAHETAAGDRRRAALRRCMQRDINYDPRRLPDIVAIIRKDRDR